MHRDQIIQDLQVYAAKWNDECDTTSRFINFVSTHTDCFERGLKKGHVTGSAWVVNNEGTHVLLTHHRQLNKWLQLGGHADGDPDIVNVALREAGEESGLKELEILGDEIFDLDIHRIPRRAGEPEHYHYDIRYAVRSVGNEEFVVSSESHQLHWIRIEELERLTSEESMLRMATKWKTHINTSAAEA